LVDDDKEVADAYALRLKGMAEVKIAYSGEEALEITNPADPPDVVLLDRHMPSLSGDEVLAELHDIEIQTRIIMVTAIDPGLGILDLPFDEYLCKPVEREDVRAAVNHQCEVLAYELLGEYFQLESKRAVIEAELPSDQLDESDAFTAVDEQIDTLETRLSRLLPDFQEQLDSFSDIGREGY
jgi:Response regulator containing CheY-like receiver, AAA-type ATPase, and DNA-binding domains